MSKRHGHTDFVPVLGATYTNGYFAGVITEVGERYTASNGKELFRFEIVIDTILDPEKCLALGIQAGQVTHRQATPNQRANGQFNTLRNHGE